MVPRSRPPQARPSSSGDAERLTGFNVGRINPFGQRKNGPTAIDETAGLFDEVLINGGRRGLLVGLGPADAVRVADARLANLTA